MPRADRVWVCFEIGVDGRNGRLEIGGLHIADQPIPFLLSSV